MERFCMLSPKEIRRRYLEFFQKHGHEIVRSAPLIPPNDPTLLFTNAGMVQFKKCFTGEEKRGYTRATTAQKCLRVSGKHNDLENVGRTARHHTFFEMLGNFSFGDYFKKEAIPWAWEFLTSPEWVGLDPNRLYPSVFAGNETTPADDEAWHIWHDEIGIPADHIFKFGKEDNFWEHGSGPCGPCSEIYYDRGEKYGCGKPGCTVGCECDRYMEVWNIVFSQFNNDGQGHYTELAQKNIDTGMGLERLAVVCQDVDSLFDVDTVMNITNHVSRITGAHYGDSDKVDVSLRIITDHIRASVMMISDGVLPSNEGRGYVLRRLLRRAARHGKLLGVNKPFLFEVCDTVIHENERHYPELREKQAYITKVIRVEEENFAKTIDGGLKIFGDMLADHKAKGESVFSGADAFKLYDTYGFPIDLTLEMAEDEGLTVDQDAFQQLMEEQRVRARKAREALGDLGWAGIEFGKDMPETVFTGYTKNTDEGKILALVSEDELQDTIGSGVEGIIVLDKTPFYAEMGGQVADQGAITCGEAVFEVTNVQKNKGGKFMHYGHVKSGSFSVGNTVIASIDVARRKAICRSHSATHLLQKALQTVLGDHVHQAGSLNEPDRLRFDFTHFSAVSPEDLFRVEQIVNHTCLEGGEVVTDVMSLEEAKKLGAMALFGEKYGDTVRVVRMKQNHQDYSMEFCGGTHVSNIAMIGAFHIKSEGSVASGVRRIEATTGRESLRTMTDVEHAVVEAAAMLKAKPAELAGRIEAQLSEIRELRRELDGFKSKEILGEADRYLLSAKNVGEMKVITATLNDADAATLRKVGDFLRDKEQKVVAVLSSVKDGKITFLAVCGKEAVKAGVRAGDLIKNVTKICGGSGGGKPDSAMGGGKDLLKLDDALATVDDFVAEKLGL
jgi:alanyl-tRNA synthetase